MKYNPLDEFRKDFRSRLLMFWNEHYVDAIMSTFNDAYKKMWEDYTREYELRGISNSREV